MDAIYRKSENLKISQRLMESLLGTLRKIYVMKWW